MCKKLTLAVVGLVVVGALLFGGKVIPYAQTAFEKARSTVEGSVPIDFQIDAARTQLGKIQPEIKNMVWKIAQEKAQIKKLGTEVDRQANLLEKRYDEMMTLRNHLSSGDEVYVATNGKAYPNERVTEDLRHRFTVYQTAEQTLQKSKDILELRRQALTAALEGLDSAQAQQRELEVQIENLSARKKMVDVAKSASEINLDDSQLAKTRQMIEDINSKIDTEEEMMNLAPKYLGQIPVGDEILEADKDILSEMDAYFNKSADENMVQSDK